MLSKSYRYPHRISTLQGQGDEGYPQEVRKRKKTSKLGSFAAMWLNLPGPQIVQEVFIVKSAVADPWLLKLLKFVTCWLNICSDMLLICSYTTSLIMQQYFSIYLFIFGYKCCNSMQLSIYQSINLSICLTIYLSTYPFLVNLFFTTDCFYHKPINSLINLSIHL